jgi:hypothetical protein
MGMAQAPTPELLLLMLAVKLKSSIRGMPYIC